MTEFWQGAVSIWDKGCVACYHPIPHRFFPCAQVQKCAVCKAVRFTDEPFVDPQKYWPPTTPP